MYCPDESGSGAARIVCHSCCSDLVYDGRKDGTAPCDAAYVGRGCWRPFGESWKQDATVLAAQAQQSDGSLQTPKWQPVGAAPVDFQDWVKTWPSLVGLSTKTNAAGKGRRGA
jgi:hypothetical protein